MNAGTVTVHDIHKRIEAMKARPEAAGAMHATEDGIWASALRAIAKGDEHPAELAAAALKTLDIEFTRLCWGDEIG